MIRSTLTERWQTTIPSPIRKALGLKPRQKLTYELVEGGVLLRPDGRESLLDLAGALRTTQPCSTKADERDAARQARVGRYR